MRVDDRRIHGQVAIAWSKTFQFQVLIVANDESANSKIQTMTLKSAAPGTRVEVYTIEKTIELLNDPRSDKMNLGIIVTNLVDCMAIAKGATAQVKRINIGNYGKLSGGAMSVTEKRRLSDGVIVDPSDVELLKEMKAIGIPIDVQLLPYLQMVTLDDVLKF